MKVLRKLLAIAFLTIAASPLMAKTENSIESLVSVKKIEPGKVQIAYYGKSPEKVHVHIYNEKNQEVFKETINSKRGIKKPYNLRELPYGDYKFEVKVANEVTVHNISYEAPKYPGNVVMLASACGQGKIKTMLMGPGQKDFKLRIYDEHNRLLFKQEIRQQGNYGKVINIQDPRVRKVRLVLSNHRDILQEKTINL